MKFKKLVKKHNWDKVCISLLKLYPNQKKSVYGYKRVYKELKSLRPAKTKMRIVLEDIFDECDKKYYMHVSGRNGTLNKESNPEYFKDDKVGNRETSYAIEYVPWGEWLGMDIDPTSLKKYNELEIIAHCLYEMTFAGFDQNTIKKEMEEIKRCSKEVENMTDEKKRKRLIPWETVKKRFGKK